MSSYVLITPARDEEAYIEKTIASVLAQTILPRKWVIVSDGSVDRTDEIVRHYAGQYELIALLRRSADRERNFGSKARAFRAGYEQVAGIEHGFVGNLDADVSFGSAYFEGILSKFAANQRLGIAGGIRFDLYKGRFRKVRCAHNSVGGPFQLFRRQCYEQIGGYQPLRFGGIDTVAETMARMRGWEVESFPEFAVYHYRCTGTASGGIVESRFKAGKQDYVVGNHPLFEIARTTSRVPDYPFAIGSLAWIAGYGWAALKYEKAMPDDFVRYLREEQLERLREAVAGTPKVFLQRMALLRPR